MVSVDLILVLSFFLFLFFLYKLVFHKTTTYIKNYREEINERFSKLSHEHIIASRNMLEKRLQLDDAHKKCQEILEQAHQTAEHDARKLKEEHSKYINSRNLANQHILKRLSNMQQQFFLKLMVEHIMKKTELSLRESALNTSRLNDFKEFMKNEFSESA